MKNELKKLKEISAKNRSGAISRLNSDLIKKKAVPGQKPLPQRPRVEEFKPIKALGSDTAARLPANVSSSVYC